MMRSRKVPHDRCGMNYERTRAKQLPVPWLDVRRSLPQAGIPTSLTLHALLRLHQSFGFIKAGMVSWEALPPQPGESPSRLGFREALALIRRGQVRRHSKPQASMPRSTVDSKRGWPKATSRLALETTILPALGGGTQARHLHGVSFLAWNSGEARTHTYGSLT